MSAKGHPTPNVLSAQWLLPISVILTIAMVQGISMEMFAAYTGEKAQAYKSADCTITYSMANG